MLAVRTQFIERVSEANLRKLLDELLEEDIINADEKESVEHLSRARKARALIDMVRQKGPAAKSVLIAALCDVDPVLSEELKLL